MLSTHVSSIRSFELLSGRRSRRALQLSSMPVMERFDQKVVDAFPELAIQCVARRVGGKGTMSDNNPFAGPYGQGGGFFGTKPGTGADGLCCPQCKAKDWDVSTRPHEILRICRVCKNEWSGGTMGVAQLDPTYVPSPPNSQPEDDDIPLTQYTGADFRDPSKNY